MPGLQIGPRALDAMAGYRPEWSPTVAPQAPRGPGLGRLLLVIVLVAGLLTQLPTEEVQADAFAGNSVSCTTSRHVVTQFNLQGYNYAAVSFHLSIPEGGTVYGRWEGSSGVIGTSRFWSAGTDGDLEWYVTSVGQSFGTGASGTATYALYKVQGYGGCYSVDQASVMTVPVPANGPGGGLITPNPSQLQEDPDATAAPTAPPGYDCNGSTDIEGCDAPPSGWCWIQTGAMYGSVGYVLQQCEDEGDEPATGTGGDPLSATCRATAGTNNSCTVTFPAMDIGESMPWSVTWDYSHTGRVGHSDRHPVNGSWVIFQQVQCNHTDWADFASVTGSGSTASSGGTGSGTYTATNGSWVEGACTRANATAAYTVCGDWWCDVSGTYIDFNFGYGAVGDADDDGWSDTEEAACGSDPEDPDDVCSQAPEGFPDPSGLPPGPGMGGGPVDQCEGPDDAALPMCGGFDFPTFPPYPSFSFPPGLCAPPSPGAPTPAIAACASIPSEGPGGSAVGMGEFLPEASDLMAQLGGKVPFAYLDAAGDAVSGLSGGATPSLCHAFAIGPLGAFEFCIPEEPFEFVGTWRWLLAGILWFLILLKLLSVATSTVSVAKG